MAIPAGFIEDLLSRVDVIDVVGRYVQLKKTGANFSALCPFHNEKSPSFSVSPSKQFYHCFGCGKSGDAITFLMEHTGLTFVEAVTELAQQHGLQVPDDRPLSDADRQRQAEQKQKKATLLEVMERAAQHYRQQLRTAPDAVQYLKNRGLTGKIAAHFGLGYAPPGWHHLSSVFADYTDPLLEEGGLVIRQTAQPDTAQGLMPATPFSPGAAGAQQRRHDRFRHRIMFPIRNVRGECIGFGGRVLDGSKPKYLNSPETPLFSKGRELYGLYEARSALREHGYALVVEGYMDVVALAQWGFANAVATLGTACTGEHVHKLFRYTDHIVFSFDGDSAGQRAAQKALLAALPYATDVRSIKFLFLPSEHDPDSYIRTYGAEAFGAAIKSALPLSQFMQHIAAQGLDMDSAEGRAHLASNARPMWQALPDGALKTQILAELATTVGIPAPDLQQLWHKTAVITRAPHSDTAPGQRQNAHQGMRGNTYQHAEPHAHQMGYQTGYRDAYGQAPLAMGTPQLYPYHEGYAHENAGYIAHTGGYSSGMAQPYKNRRGRTPMPAPSMPRYPTAVVARAQPASRADHALRLLLQHMYLWECVAPDVQAMLCALPAPHGGLFGWLDAQHHEHGPLGWTALSEALQQHVAGEWAGHLVAQQQALGGAGNSEDVRIELESALHGLLNDDLARQASTAASAGDTAAWQQITQRQKELKQQTLVAQG